MNDRQWRPMHVAKTATSKHSAVVENTAVHVQFVSCHAYPDVYQNRWRERQLPSLKPISETNAMKSWMWNNVLVQASICGRRWSYRDATLWSRLTWISEERTEQQEEPMVQNIRRPSSGGHAWDREFKNIQQGMYLIHKHMGLNQIQLRLFDLLWDQNSFLMGTGLET